MLRDRAQVRARCARARRKFTIRAKILRDLLHVRGLARARDARARARKSCAIVPLRITFLKASRVMFES